MACGLGLGRVPARITAEPFQRGAGANAEHLAERMRRGIMAVEGYGG